MHGWIGDRRDEWRRTVAPSAVYLFSMHTLPSKIFVMQILAKNLSCASGELHCLWVLVDV